MVSDSPTPREKRHVTNFAGDCVSWCSECAPAVKTAKSSNAIAGRLRHWLGHPACPSASVQEDLRAGIDEIARLEQYGDDVRLDCQKFQAEIERLRERVAQITRGNEAQAIEGGRLRDEIARLCSELRGISTEAEGLEDAEWVRNRVGRALAGAEVPSEDPLDAWKDMSSAPKDGCRILALVPQRQFYPDSSNPDEVIPVVVRWAGEYQEWSMPGIGGLRPTLWKPIVLTRARES